MQGKGAGHLGSPNHIRPKGPTPRNNPRPRILTPPRPISLRAHIEVGDPATVGVPPIAAAVEVSDSPVGGRLLAFAEAWRGASRWQRRVISRGLSWKWLDQPPQLKLPTFRAANPQLTPYVENLLRLKVIKKVPRQKCFQSRMFTVPKQSGELRPILDLKGLNSFIRTPTFTMSNHQTLREILPDDAWLASLDIEDAYLHVPVQPSLQRFLAFSHGDNLFFFQALPFGLTSAPYIFSRLMAYPLQILRNLQVPVLAYLDDWIVWEQSPDKLQEATAITLRTLQNLGFRINWGKSCLLPTQDLTWLGVRWMPHESSLGLTKKFQIKLQGKWSTAQRALHINAKEPVAVVLAVQSPLVPAYASVSLSLDNLTTFFRIRNQGSHKSASKDSQNAPSGTSTTDSVPWRWT